MIKRLILFLFLTASARAGVLYGTTTISGSGGSLIAESGATVTLNVDVGMQGTHLGWIESFDFNRWLAYDDSGWYLNPDTGIDGTGKTLGQLVQHPTMYTSGTEYTFNADSTETATIGSFTLANLTVGTSPYTAELDIDDVSAREGDGARILANWSNGQANTLAVYGGTNQIFTFTNSATNTATATLDFVYYGSAWHPAGSNIVFTGTGGLPSYDGAGLSNGLLAYYEMDETGGDRADVSGTNTLVDNGGVDFTAGIINNASSFAGDSLYLSTGTYISSTGTVSRSGTFTAISVSAWVKTTDSGVGLNVGNFAVTASPECVRLITVGADAVFQIEETGGGGVDHNASSSGVTVNDGNWHHILGTWDGTTQTVYVDGVAVGTNSYSGACVYKAQFQVGISNSADAPSTAAIDEVGVWNVCLTGSNALQLYNSGAGQPFSAFTP